MTSEQPSGYSGFFSLLGIINNASMNIEVHIALQIHVLFPSGKHTEEGLLDDMVILFLNFDKLP